MCPAVASHLHTEAFVLSVCVCVCVCVSALCFIVCVCVCVCGVISAQFIQPSFIELIMSEDGGGGKVLEERSCLCFCDATRPSRRTVNRHFSVCVCVCVCVSVVAITEK